MTDNRRLLITAPGGSGGSYTHLAEVLPRLMKLRASWAVELYAPPEVLLACFGTRSEPWMRPLASGSYAHRLLWEFGELPGLLRADRQALVWAPFGPPVNIALAARTVWMSRNIIPLLPRRQWEVSGADRPRLMAIRAIVLLWARRARTTICVSQDARARLARMARVDPAQMPVIPHGVRPADDHIRCTSPYLEALRERPYLLYVGQPTAYRRTRELFRAYSDVASIRPDIPPLLAAGAARPFDVPYERACLHELRPAVLRKRAHVLGQISHADVLALMAKAHAFLYPSVHENCPNIVLEALSAGRAAVYADIAPVRELTDSAGLFVRDPRPVGLAAAIERASFDESLRVEIAGSAKGRAANFTWELTAERTARALDGAFAG